MAGTEDAKLPFFSPDGQSVAFFARGRLFRWDRGGGAPQPLADAPSQPLGGTWGEDGTIVFVPVWNGGLYRVPASGRASDAEALILPDGQEHYAFVYPRFVPGREEVLFTAWGERGGIWRLDLASSDPSEVVTEGNSGTLTTSGHLLFAMRQPVAGLLATPQSSSSGAESSPTSVLPGVHYLNWSTDLWLSVSRTGTLAYAPSDVTRRSLVRVDWLGQTVPVADQPGVYGNLAISPNGRRIAADVDNRVWLYEPDGGRVRLAPENRDRGENNPTWDPEESRVFYSSNQSGTWDIYTRVPGAATSEVVLRKELDQTVEAVADDGTLAFSESHPATGYDIWLLPTGGTPRAWQATTASEVNADFSPDGRWLAYSSNVSTRFEVYVGPVDGESEERTQVTTEGGQGPVWSPMGDRLFYRRGATMMAVDVVSLDPLVLGGHQRLFDGGWELPGPEEPNLKTYAVAPDGELFVIFDTHGNTGRNPIC